MIQSKSFCNRTGLKTVYIDFLIEVATEAGQPLVVYRLTQRCNGKATDRQLQRLTNQVESHLNDLSVNTGLRYAWLWRGPKDAWRNTSFERMWQPMESHPLVKGLV